MPKSTVKRMTERRSTSGFVVHEQPNRARLWRDYFRARQEGGQADAADDLRLQLFNEYLEDAERLANSINAGKIASGTYTGAEVHFEEVSGEASVCLWRAIRGYKRKNNASFKTYLTKCLSGHFSDVAKRLRFKGPLGWVVSGYDESGNPNFIRKRMKSVSFDHYIQAEGGRDDEDDDAPQKSTLQRNRESTRRGEVIEFVRDHLSDDQAELVSLKYEQELTYAEVGEILGRSESSVRREISRITERLASNPELRALIEG